MAQRIAYDNRDWTALREPTRSLAMASARRSTACRLQAHVADVEHLALDLDAIADAIYPDTDEWLNCRADKVTDTAAWGKWTMLVGQVHIWPALEVDQSAYFAYLHRDPHRVGKQRRLRRYFHGRRRSLHAGRARFELGIIWQWKAQKGAPYAEDMGTYGDALTYAMGHDDPPRSSSAGDRFGQRPLCVPVQARTGYVT